MNVRSSGSAERFGLLTAFFFLRLNLLVIFETLTLEKSLKNNCETGPSKVVETKAITTVLAPKIKNNQALLAAPNPKKLTFSGVPLNSAKT